MRNRICKFFICLFLVSIIGALVAFNALLIWVATGPRSLDSASSYIADALSATDGSYTIKIGATKLIWDGWKHPLDIRLHEVTLMTKAGVVSSFPEIALDLDVLALPFGRILPTSLTVRKPVIRLFQNADRSVTFGLGDETSADEQKNVSGEALSRQLFSKESNNPLRKLRVIRIRDAALSIGNSRGIFFKANDANIQLRRVRKFTLEATAEANIRYEDYETPVALRFSYSKDHPTLDGQVEIRNAMPARLSELLVDDPIGKALQFPISGGVKFSFAHDGTLKLLQFAIEGGEGKFVSEHLDGELPVKRLKAEGSVSENGSYISIGKFEAELQGAVISGMADIQLNGDKSAVKAQIQGTHIAVDQAHVFWPPELSPMSREWVIGNIHGGMMSQAQAVIDIKPGDLAEKTLPKDAIKANIQLENANVRYLAEHPEASGIYASIVIDAQSLHASINAADFLKDTKVQKGTVAIDDLNEDNPYIKLSLEATSTARDVVHFLGLPKMGQAKRLNLSEDATGTVKGSSNLGFRFFAPRDETGRVIGEPDVDFDIKADGKAISQKQFMRKFDISNGEGHFTVNNKQFTFEGKGGVNGAEASAVKVTYLFTPENGYDTFIDTQASAPVSVMPRFGYPDLPFVTGNVALKASMKQGEAQEQYKATVDLTQAELTIKDIAWIKHMNVPGTLDFTAEKKNGDINFSSFHLKGDGMDATGNAQLTKDLSGFKRISLDALLLGKTDLKKLVYQPRPGGFSIEAYGDTADMSGILHKEEGEESTFSFQHFPAVRFEGEINRFIVGDGRELSEVKGMFDCGQDSCAAAEIRAKAGGKPMLFRIQPQGHGKRQLTIRAEDAGAFLNAMNVMDGMQAGELNITGVYEGDDEHARLTGKVDISEHTVKNAPILANILSLASLTGFFDTLQGNGIRFVKLSAPFTLQNDVITLTNAKMHGPAIGLTAEGTIRFPGVLFDIQGTVVPSYTLNSVLGNVPLLGNVLTGGEGQGVFAARYYVTGNEKKPNVSVNPLSILTPGFLRGLFDVFDGPKKKDGGER